MLWTPLSVEVQFPELGYKTVSKHKIRGTKIKLKKD